MEISPQDQLLRLKIASEIVLGNQAVVAFSRAFYLEDILVERINKEFLEVSRSCHELMEKVKAFVQEVADDTSSNLSPLSESSVRCQCSEMLESLGTSHEPMLESFRQKLIQAKARRQAKSFLLEKLSIQNKNVSSQFNTMTLAELVNQVHIPEFSCFINDSDFGILENLVDDWDLYRDKTKDEFDMYERKLTGFRLEKEKAARTREYTCDMILAQITQQKHSSVYGSNTLKKKGVFHKFSTLLRRRHSHQNPLGSLSIEPTHNQSDNESPSQFTVASNNQQFQQTF